MLGRRPDACAPGDDGLAVRVDLAEDLGDRRDARYESASGATLVGRVAPSPALVEGREVRLPVDLGRTHLFAADARGARLD